MKRHTTNEAYRSGLTKKGDLTHTVSHPGIRLTSRDVRKIRLLPGRGTNFLSLLRHLRERSCPNRTSPSELPSPKGRSE